MDDEISSRASLQRRGTPSCVCNVGDMGYVNSTNEHTTFRTPVDWNLEQIMSMLMPIQTKGDDIHSVSARRKWIVTRSVQSELVSYLIESQD